MDDQASQPPEIKVQIDAPVTTNDQQPQGQLSASVNQLQTTRSILTGLHAGYFSVSLSFGAQALLWKTHSNHTDDSPLSLHRIFHKVPSIAFLLFWWLALWVLIALSLLYFLRCIFHFHMVKANFVHYVRVNYLFFPCISWLILIYSAPFIIPNTVSFQVLCWVFLTPMVILDVKTYGQCLTTKRRFLSMTANPTSQISVIGNSVGAWAAAQMGWRECAICIFSLGLAHYLVVFITLYQRISGGGRIPEKLHPVFFLFVAAPSMASLAWKTISGTFDTPCKMLFFLSLFLFMSLACRPALFKKSMKRFNVAWWAYSYPVTFLALASTEYAQQVKGMVAPRLTLVLTVISVLVFVFLMVFTALNADKLRRKDCSSLGISSNLETSL